MAWPDVSSEFETFFDPTRIFLFGKEFKSLIYNRASMGPDYSKPAGAGRHGANHSNEFMDYSANLVDGDPARGVPPDQLQVPPSRLERTLRKQGYDGDEPVARIFARIYSFSFEGHYYRLPRPLLFLVSGQGDPGVDPAKPTQRGHRRPDDDQGDPTYAGRHEAFKTKFSGVVGEDWQFSDDVRVWAVDRKDLAVCLDVEIGNYQEILLQPMSRGGGGPPSRGDMVSRGDITGRGDGSSRAGGGAFRGDMIGPHQNW